MKKFALFDFDKTITCENSIVTLVKFVLRSYPLKSFYYALKTLLGLFLAIITRDYRRLKTPVLQCYDILNAEEKTHFLYHIMPKKYYQDALAEIQKRKDQGYTLCLVSASMEPYVVPLGKDLGFDYVLGTRFENGKIIGLNHRHKEKVARLEELFKHEKIVYEKTDSVAYSDSYRADQPMLDLAEHKYLINCPVKKEGYINLTWS